MADTNAPLAVQSISTMSVCALSTLPLAQDRARIVAVAVDTRQVAGNRVGRTGTRSSTVQLLCNRAGQRTTMFLVGESSMHSTSQLFNA